MSPAVLALKLVGDALICANEIFHTYPDIVFTSGLRTRQQQVHAMATNVSKQRNWIALTYKASKASDACHDWVLSNPRAVSVAAIAEGLMTVLDSLQLEEVKRLSKHLTGEAFDVLPIDGMRGEIVLEGLRKIVTKHKGTLLEREGGLRRWHAQF